MTAGVIVAEASTLLRWALVFGISTAKPQGKSQILGHGSATICRLPFDELWADIRIWGSGFRV